MTGSFSQRVITTLAESDRQDNARVAQAIKARLWADNPMLAEKCLEFQEALGGYSIVGRYRWRFRIDMATEFEDEGISYVECAAIDVAAPFDVNINNLGQICADTIPMAETFAHFIEREAIANWCRMKWKDGRRLRTADSRIEHHFDSHTQLQKVHEACDKWETWWINEDVGIAACKFHLWGSEDLEEYSYWLFDTQDSVLGDFGSVLKSQNIGFSIDPWTS